MAQTKQRAAADKPTKEKARETAQEAGEKAKEQVDAAVGKTRGVVGRQTDRLSTQAGDRMATTADDVGSVADALREQGHDGPAKIADEAQRRSQDVATYLRDSDGDKILRDVEDFGRRQPMVIAIGGLALGFLAARMMRASSSDRYRASAGQYSGGRRQAEGGQYISERSTASEQLAPGAF